MRLILTADLHNGIPNKLAENKWSMELLEKYAIENNIQNILILGDLFHDRVSIQIEALNMVYDLLSNSKVHWTCFCGNHDLFLKDSWQINSLHYLSNVMEVIEGISNITIDNRKFWILPFIYQESKYMQKLQEINEQADPEDVLLTHIGVNNAIRNECFLLKQWSLVHFEETKFKKVFTGHFHCHQEIGKTIYPGSPIAFRFDEGLVDHGFIVLDTNTLEHSFIKNDVFKSENKPPDYITILDKDLPKNTAWLPGNNIRVLLSQQYTANKLQKIKQLLHSKGALSISWQILEKTVEEHKVQYKETHFGTPEELFKSYVKVDQPKLDLDLLLKLHTVISKEAEELMITEEVNA
jgi:DNA repair exonuclease SbcCD nuclease subunit